MTGKRSAAVEAPVRMMARASRPAGEGARSPAGEGASSPAGKRESSPVGLNVSSPAGESASRRRDRWLRLASLGAFVLVWQVAAMFADSRTLPEPLTVLARIVDETVSLSLPGHLAVTLGRVAVAFTAAMLIGALAGGFGFGQAFAVTGVVLAAVAVVILAREQARRTPAPPVRG